MLLPVGLFAALALPPQGARPAPKHEPPTPTHEQLEQEVIENVLRQPLGAGTVLDLALPEEFVRRVADRIVRSSYEERYRIVVQGRRSAAGLEGAPASAILVSVGLLVLAALAWIVLGRRQERTAP